MRSLAISGVPGTGKSTLMFEILDQLGGTRSTSRYGTCDYINVRSGEGIPEVRILGKYTDGDLFAGTDKLSMSVQEDAEGMASAIHYGNYNLAFEGDRLTNSAFIKLCMTLGELRFIVLKVDPKILEERRANRSAQAGKEQNETWLRGRESKVYRLQQVFDTETFVVDTHDQTVTLASSLVDWLLNKVETPEKRSTRLF